MAGRRKYWQLGITLRVITFGLIVTALLTLISFIALTKAVTASPNSLAWKNNLILMQIVFCGTLLAFLIIILHLVQRSLGPLFRVEKILDEVLKGDYTQRIAIREKDFLRGFIEKVNTMLEQLSAPRKQ